MSRPRGPEPEGTLPFPGGALPTTTNGHTPARDAALIARGTPVDPPPHRCLRVYAFDPTLSMQLEHAVINNVMLKVPWEFNPRTGKLDPGPVGEYVEVIDYDPASDCFYVPVDLEDGHLLARDGLDPSEGCPQFHQQMVYAVAMTTIKNFERALGRRILWAAHRTTENRKDDNGDWSKRYEDHYVQRLRIYPHALREANAYYSPEKVALLFGYFPATASDVRHHLPGGIVFTCLSHDIIAHETTHAILDGIHKRFNEPSNPDVLAFHEAFADIVALFQHFSFPEVLRHQIARTKGDLASENLLAQLAQQFGQSLGGHGALRDALGDYDRKTDTWTPKERDPSRLQQTTEPHERGSILVAAVFDAFISIYKKRTGDLLRIASNGTGVLPEGYLHPDLVNRLASDAAKSAQHVLNMCIRALDYCPPVDITFGDYLRALITADFDLVPDDDLGYRIAMVEAFRQHGIYPRDVRSLSVDSLRWSPPSQEIFEGEFLEAFKKDLRREIEQWNLKEDRRLIFKKLRDLRRKLHVLIASLPDESKKSLKGMTFEDESKFEVHSVRPVRRVSPDGELLLDLIIEITQWRPGYFDPVVQDMADDQMKKRGGKRGENLPKPDFIFRGGGTLIVDLDTFDVRYYIYKDITNTNRLERQRRFLTDDTDTSLRSLYFGAMIREDGAEPFAFLHRSNSEEGWV